MAAPEQTGTRTLRYRNLAGDADVAVRVAVPELVAILERFYPDYRADGPGDEEPSGPLIRLERDDSGYMLVGPSGDWPADEAGEAVALYEAELTDALLAGSRRFIYLHAAAVSDDTACMLLVGDSGTGKSTLTFGLKLEGLRQLSDDVVLIDPAGGRVAPFRRSIRVHRKGLRRLGVSGDLPAGAQLCEPYLWVHPDRAGGDGVGAYAIRALVFLARGRQTGLERLPASGTLRGLLRGRFGSEGAARYFDCFSRLAAELQGYTLTVRRFPEALVELKRAFVAEDGGASPRLRGASD